MANQLQGLISDIYLTQNSLLAGMFFPYHSMKESKSNNQNEDYYLNSDLNIIYVHNPKTAGTSIKKFLGLDISGTNHKTPTYLTSKRNWQNNFSVLSVRHPIDRLISSYYYHISPQYKGGYLKKFPNLLTFSFEMYFEVMKKEPWAIRPQVDYLTHLFSPKKVDFIIRFEELHADLNKLSKTLGLGSVSIPHLNSTKRVNNENYFLESKSLVKKINAFYKKDFEVFGYEPTQLI